ncbi:MAG TPA: choice-of-anchor L domain-containing protein, partial [Ignavibacteriaceae bacterium]
FISGANPSGGNYSNQNFAFVPNTSLPIIINNINSSVNSQYFVNNTSGPVMFDGFTTLLEFKIPVVPSTVYNMTIGIADGIDLEYDSGAFIKSHSLQSYGKTSGISKAVKNNLINFYPNPATKKITLNTTVKGTLIISDYLGEFIDVKKIKDKHTIISKENFQPGIYFLTFQAEGSSTTRKLIIH